MAIYEACVGNYIEAIEAEERGANRIELCDNLMQDGTTPSYGTIKLAVEKTNIPVMVIIRPRGGNFEYSSDEVEIMKEDIKVCKNLGAHGVVIGALKGKEIDIETIEALLQECEGLSVTFHMAFDEIEDKYKAIDKLAELGINRILTKGGKANAIEGKDELKAFSEYANGKISIMPGKSVTKENRDYLLEYTNTVEIHGSKVV